MERRDFLTLSAAAPATAALFTPPALAALKGDLRVTSLETDLLRLPPGRPYSDAIHDFGPDRGGVVLRLSTNAGITGWAYSSFGMIAGGPDVLQKMLESELKPVITGKDPAFPKAIRTDLWKAVEYAGVQGMATFALAAIDIAVWDILGKAVGWPVYKMLGAVRDRIPTYAMCGWYYPNDNDLSQYRRAIEDHLAEGFQAVKIKVGRSDLDDDVRRIHIAQEICGKNRRVMVDANQVFNRVEALRRGRVYQQMGCYWFEEPLPPHDKDGLTELARELDMRIATGENEYSKYSFLDLLKREAVDVVQPDNRRAGGVTEWMEIGAISDAFGKELASHGGGPTNLHMLCAMPNAIYIESGSLKGESSSVEKLRMENGALLAPTTPGMGSELRADYIRKFRVG